MSKRPNASRNMLLLIAMCFIVLRGPVVLLASNFIQNADLIYWTAGALFYLLGAIGLYKLLICNVRISNRLKQLLCINFVLMTYWTISEVMAGGDFTALNAVFLLLGLAPFSLLLLKELSEDAIRVFLSVVTVIVSLSVFYDFAQLNNLFGFGDLEAAMSRHALLRAPEAFGKSNNLYRPIGIMGPLPHNASQINSMLAVYWFLLLFNAKSYRYFMIAFGLFICSFVAVILALVVSNAIAMLVGLGVGLIMNATHLRKNMGRLLLVAVIIVFLIWFYGLGMAPAIIEAVAYRADSNTGDWANMLDWRDGSFTPDLMSFLFGHDALMGSRLGTLEIGLLGLIFQLGIFIALPFYYLMTYPIVRFVSSGIHPSLKRQFVPEAMAILTGVLTMWHYKSLLQTPNMIVFLVIYISAVMKYQQLIRQGAQGARVGVSLAPR